MLKIGTKVKGPYPTPATIVGVPKDPANLWDLYELECDDGTRTAVSQRTMQREWEVVKSIEIPPLPDQNPAPKGLVIPDSLGTHTAPPRRTFYLAASSKDLLSVRRRATELRDLGYDWYGGLDWTNYVDNMPESFYGAVTAMDLAAATHADVFVLVLDTANLSFGAAAEYGARLTSGKIANVVSAEKTAASSLASPEGGSPGREANAAKPKHPFLFHANTRWWSTWEAFLAGGLK